MSASDRGPGDDGGDTSPGPVRLAGAIWLGYGVLAASAGVAATVLAVGLFVAGGPAMPLVVACSAATLLGPPGVGLALAGWRAVRGPAADIPGPTYVALALGLSALMLGAGALVLDVTLPVRGLDGTGVAVAASLAVTGAVLSVSGFLPLLGRRGGGDAP